MKLFPLILVGLLAVVIGSGIFLVTVGRNIGEFFFGKSFAEGQLKEYVASVLNDEVNGVSCQAYDTDNNGYVACDYTTTKQPGATRSIDCAAWGISGFLNRGCKTRMPNFQTN
jgi:hypothetical protein